MGLKELIKDVEEMKAELLSLTYGIRYKWKLRGIKQTVEAVDNEYTFGLLNQIKEWKKLKELLGVK